MTGHMRPTSCHLFVCLFVYLDGPLLAGVPGLLAVGDDRGEVGALKLLDEGRAVHLQVADPGHIVPHSVLHAGRFVEGVPAPSQLTLQLWRRGREREDEEWLP